ncbi:MAG: TIGR01777 family oxidoreductase, partial [Candidatus Nanopelagicales bacterium]|nr:TIGR01777 family oxidoreductase [Candidatus Nanopelagicales bacterium]
WVDCDAFEAAEVTGVVHLAGAGVGDRRWTAAYQRTILDSRVQGTRAIASAVAKMDPQPALVSGSAIGYYGDTGNLPVDESGACGTTFLANVVRQWEEATAAARQAGARVVCARTGLVVSAHGGAFARLIKLTRMGLGGRVGSGNQLWSFIALADEVAALRWTLEHDVEGPINLVAPHPVPNRKIMREMGRVLHRPSIVPAPAAALRIAVGKFAGEILASQGVLPGRLSQGGFTWQAPTFGAALELELGVGS